MLEFSFGADTNEEKMPSEFEFEFAKRIVSQSRNGDWKKNEPAHVNSLTES